MKGLREYQQFNAKKFFQDKTLLALKAEPWSEYKEGKVTKELGTTYKCVIASDNSIYKSGIKDLNAGEQINVKVNKPAKSFKKMTPVTLINPTATIYGQYQSELSVKADDIEFQ